MLTSIHLDVVYSVHHDFQNNFDVLYVKIVKKPGLPFLPQAFRLDL